MTTRARENLWASKVSLVLDTIVHEAMGSYPVCGECKRQMADEDEDNFDSGHTEQCTVGILSHLLDDGTKLFDQLNIETTLEGDAKLIMWLLIKKKPETYG